MISNCSWPSCGVHYFSSSRHQLLIRRRKIKMEEQQQQQQFARVLLLRKEFGLDLSQKCPLVCKILVGGGWLEHRRVPAAAYALQEAALTELPFAS